MGSLIPKKDLKDWLETWVLKYESPKFIEKDPISIPHNYPRAVDKEFVGFMTAIISWGRRKSILNSASKMFSYFGDQPVDDLVELTDEDIYDIYWSHRTFLNEDGWRFLQSFRNYYRKNNSLEKLFSKKSNETDYNPSIDRFRLAFSEGWSHERSLKHLASPGTGSAAKRIHLFLRWMVRSDVKGVDFGIWRNLDPRFLSCPLDIHSGKVARSLGILKRNRNDFTALKELDKNLRKFDKKDPVKYDFALFGIGESGLLN
ncbi:MAG: TIGR02757 family protein [Schleiferiaceae bacterium]